MKNLILVAVVILAGFASSCGPNKSASNQPAIIVDSPLYHINQYVYIHGEVKGIVKDNHNTHGCGCGGNKVPQYKVVVAGMDGSSHTWYVNDNEITVNRDTVIVKYVTDSNTVTKEFISKSIDSIIYWNNKNIQIDMKLEKELF